VPNVATDAEGALVGLAPGTADPFTGTEAPSATIAQSFNANHWVRYPTLPPNGPFPGNAFVHGSLLAPAGGAAGALGTGRMQKDALAYLLLNQ